MLQDYGYNVFLGNFISMLQTKNKSIETIYFSKRLSMDPIRRAYHTFIEDFYKSRTKNIILQLVLNLKDYGTPPPTSFNYDPTISKKFEEKKSSLKVKIKAQTGNIHCKTVFLYTPIFKAGFCK